MGLIHPRPSSRFAKGFAALLTRLLPKQVEAVLAVGVHLTPEMIDEMRARAEARRIENGAAQRTLDAPRIERPEELPRHELQ